MKRPYPLLVVPLLLVLGGCSPEQPKTTPKPAEPAKAAEPVSGLSAIYKMYTQARAWAPDCKLLQVGSLDLKEVKSQGGKAGAWEATFVSEDSKRSRRYTLSVAASPSSGLPAGVFGTIPDSWAPGRQNSPFYMQIVKTDSTAAFDAAMKKGAEYAQKHPELPVKLLLEQTKRFPDPAWRVIWGESVATSNFSIFVDANTGNYLQTAH
jgi:hypothetical protein